MSERSDAALTGDEEAGPEEVFADQMAEEFSEELADASIADSEVLADVSSSVEDTATSEHQASSSHQIAEGEEEENNEENSRKVLWGLLGGFGSLGVVAAMAAVFGMMTGGPPVDEDDVIAAVAIAKGGEAGGTAAAAGGVSQGATSAQTAVLQQMAVSAANNAASSVASGSQALSNAAAGTAGAAGNMAAASSGNTATTAASATAVVATVAAAVVAGVVVSQRSSGGTAPICLNTTNPRLNLGSVSLDFLGNKSFLTLSEAMNLTTIFMEEYNNVFGCQSEFSRLLLNCSIPCFNVVSNDNSTTELQCCGPLVVPFFGDVMRCNIQCTVHCDGCFPNEPMFWVNETDDFSLNEDLTQAANSTNTSNFGQRYLDRNLDIVPDEDVVCSLECEVRNAVGTWFCEEISPDDPDCSILEIAAYDVVTGETASSLQFVDRPTAAPSPPLEYFLLRVLPQYEVLRQFFSGDVISLAGDGLYLSIEAIPRERDNVGSIVFTLVGRDGGVFPPRNDPPFTLGGTEVDAGGKTEYLPVFQLAWTGQKELFTTTYSEDWGTGNELLTEVLSFEVVE